MKRFSFLLILFLAACGSAAQPTFPSTQEISTMKKIRYLALGDSYTIGESVPESQRWPVQLSRRFEAEGISTELTIIARTGWTTDELWQGIQSAAPTPPYDLVSLLIGVNNQYRGRDVEDFRKEFIFLLNKSIEYAGGDSSRVFVVSIPDWGVTPFAEGRDRAQIANDIDAYNTVCREESEKAGVLYFDITPISRQDDRTLIADDGLHPSGMMYNQWVGLISPQILELFK